MKHLRLHLTSPVLTLYKCYFQNQVDCFSLFLCLNFDTVQVSFEMGEMDHNHLAWLEVMVQALEAC